MKKLLLGVLLSTKTMALGQDKIGHFVGSYAVSLSASVYLQDKMDEPELAGIGVAMTVGLFKELIDKEVSYGDLGADFLGALTGSLFHYSVKW